MDPGETQLLNDLRARTNSNVEETYPYGNNGADWVAKHFPDLVSSGVGGLIVRGANVLSMLGHSANLPEEVINAINCGNQNSPKVTFIGYSGGAQKAYTTAQDLTGKIFVNNFVAIGPIYEAYNQLNNIGRIWELVGENDFYAGKLMPGHSYNSGYRTTWGRNSRTIYSQSLDIYRHGAVRCTLYGTVGAPYEHAGFGSYIDTKTYDNGMNCGSGTLSIPHSYAPETRVDAIIDFLINVVRVGDK